MVSATGNTAVVDGVLYGGVNMTLSVSNTGDTTEAGSVWIYTLDGNPIPQGSQTVTLVGCTATKKWATCCTMTGTMPFVANTQNSSSAAAANPSVGLVTTAASSMGYAIVHTGANAPATAMTAGTLIHSQDYGTLGGNSGRLTSAVGAGTNNVTFTIGSDDFGIAGVAFSEGAAPVFGPPGATVAIAPSPVPT